MATAAVTALSTGAAHAAGSAANGQTIYNNQCAMCHASGIGPALGGVYGNQAAGVPGYAYSTALKNAKLTWDAATLDKFLAAPQTAVPGTKMTFAGLTTASDRADVIAYLATLTK
jgi:cytochrome c2